MLLNDNFSARTLVHADRIEWVPSPAKGVERRMLFRIGDEKARATSIVRYASGSRFARHTHSGGEEFFVLEGIFQDETGDFPTGTYVRNPPGTGHEPGTASGCTIFVKLWQFKKDDRQRVIRLPGEGEAGELRAGVGASLILFEGQDERVVLEHWLPGGEVEMSDPHGIELLVLDGDFTSDGTTLDRWTWLRLPANEHLQARVGTQGARVWCKFAPLLHADVCAFESDPPTQANSTSTHHDTRP